MNQKTKTLLLFVADRLKEPSTWASLATLLVGAHVIIDPGLWQHVVDIGVAVAGTLGFILGEGE